eukprot:6433152-Pyramimonas_sp.AAC.1
MAPQTVGGPSPSPREPKAVRSRSHNGLQNPETPETHHIIETYRKKTRRQESAPKKKYDAEAEISATP